MTYKILLADDEDTFRETFAMVMREEGMDVATAANGTDAIKLIHQSDFDIAILDIKMPGADGIKVLQEIKKVKPQMRVIMITAYGSVEMAVEAIKLGACDYVMKPVIFEDILPKIQRQLQFKEIEEENKQLKKELQGDYGIENIIGNSEVMQKIYDSIRKVSQTKSNVLIVGESGTGKELVAQAIHAMGPTRDNRFVGINCSAIPEALLESELFGHKKGSFTSAIGDKKGLFEIAEGGTFFLDELGHMPLNCQVKLLRAIEERQITPVGGTEPIKFNVRLIAATNIDPQKQIDDGDMREDLYYRMNVVGIDLPPLRERRDDIPLLVEHFIEKFRVELGKECNGISSEALDVLTSYQWRGNIRELQNVIERAMIFSEEKQIAINDLGFLKPSETTTTSEVENLQDALKKHEREHMYKVLRKYDYDKAAAANALGVGLSSLYRKMNELGINIDKGQ